MELLEILRSGHSGPLRFGESRPEEVHGVLEFSDTSPDEVKAKLYNNCITGDGHEFFFDDDRRLQTAKLFPNRTMIGIGGASPVACGPFEVTFGEVEVIFSGKSMQSFETLPDGLRSLDRIEEKSDIAIQIIAGDGPELFIRLAGPARSLELRYGIDTVQHGVDRIVFHRIDYFLQSFWIT